eukprot:COSAG05_NODE_1310_length_5219_cov_5.501367_4_plen_44_part_00
MVAGIRQYQPSIKSKLIVTDIRKTINSRAKVALVGAKTTPTMV